jgi:hypothetical protein
MRFAAFAGYGILSLPDAPLSPGGVRDRVRRPGGRAHGPRAKAPRSHANPAGGGRTADRARAGVRHSGPGTGHRLLRFPPAHPLVGGDVHLATRVPAQHRVDQPPRGGTGARHDGRRRDHRANALSRNAVGRGHRSWCDRLSARCRRGDGDCLAASRSAPCYHDPRRGKPRQRRLSADPLSHRGGRSDGRRLQLGRIDRPVLHRRGRGHPHRPHRRMAGDSRVAAHARSARRNAAYARGTVPGMDCRRVDPRIGRARVLGRSRGCRRASSGTS